MEFAKYSRLFETIESISKEMRSFDPRLDTLALEGLYIKETILNWQEECHSETSVDSFTKLAAIVHHALLLYHCNNFTYYSCWMTRMIPQLNHSEVDQHVAEILGLSQGLLNDTCIPAVLLLFPLRMAGVHVIESHDQGTVLEILRKTRQKGFVVSDRIEADLQEFWHYKLGKPTQINEPCL